MDRPYLTRAKNNPLKEYWEAFNNWGIKIYSEYVIYVVYVLSVYKDTTQTEKDKRTSWESQGHLKRNHFTEGEVTIASQYMGTCSSSLAWLVSVGFGSCFPLWKPASSPPQGLTSTVPLLTPLRRSALCREKSSPSYSNSDTLKKLSISSCFLRLQNYPGSTETRLLNCIFLDFSYLSLEGVLSNLSTMALSI